MQINEIYGLCVGCIVRIQKAHHMQEECSIYQQFQFSINSSAKEMERVRERKKFALALIGLVRYTVFLSVSFCHRIDVIHYAPCRRFPGLIKPIFACVASFLSFIKC